MIGSAHLNELKRGRLKAEKYFSDRVLHLSNEHVKYIFLSLFKAALLAFVSNIPSRESHNKCLDIVLACFRLNPPILVLHIHSSPVRGRCVSSVQGQFQK